MSPKQPHFHPSIIEDSKVGMDAIMSIMSSSTLDSGLLPTPPAKESIAWSEMDNQPPWDGIDEDGCATSYPYIIPDRSEADLMYERIQREKGGGSGRTKKKPSKHDRPSWCKLTPDRAKKRKAARKSRRINRKKK